MEPEQTSNSRENSNSNSNLFESDLVLTDELLQKIKNDSCECRTELIRVLECLPMWVKSDRLSDFINTPAVMRLIGIVNKYQLICPPARVFQSVPIGQWPELYDCSRTT